MATHLKPRENKYNIVISSSMGDLIMRTQRLVEDGYIPLEGCKPTNDGEMYYQTIWKPKDVAIVPANQADQVKIPQSLLGDTIHFSGTWGDSEEHKESA